MQKPVAKLFTGFVDVLFFALFLLQPFTIPGFVITSYIFIVKYILDFLFVFMEIHLLVKLVNQSGMLVRKLVFEICDESPLVQVSLVLATVLVYILSGCILKEGLMYSSSPIHFQLVFMSELQSFQINVFLSFCSSFSSHLFLFFSLMFLITR